MLGSVSILLLRSVYITSDKILKIGTIARKFKNVFYLSGCCFMVSLYDIWTNQWRMIWISWLLGIVIPCEDA